MAGMVDPRADSTLDSVGRGNGGIGRWQELWNRGRIPRWNQAAEGTVEGTLELADGRNGGMHSGIGSWSRQWNEWWNHAIECRPA